MPINVYRCEFCHDVSDTYELAVEHENTCTYNPKVKACHTCAFWSRYGAPYCSEQVEDADEHIISYCNEWEDDNA